MVYYYAKHTSPPSPRSKRVLVIIMVVLAAMALPVTLYFFKKSHATTSTLIIPVVSNQPPTTAVTPAHPTFDFYQMLPRMNAEVPNTTETIHSEGHYWLQVASLQNRNDAEQLKAHVSELGYAVALQAYRTTEGTVWNRVLAGPFQTLTEAKNSQESLRQEKLNSIVLQGK